MTAPFPSSSPPGFEARSRVEEVTPDTNPTLVWQMDIDGASAYRAYRIPSLYPGMLWTE
jgi:arylsulfate sulfotransferase